MTTDRTPQSIADVLAANELHIVPRDPNLPEPHWRDITGLPEPRPVPSPEDRMRAARQPGPTFATYLDRHDRDQLDARAATAEGERDEALDERDGLRAEINRVEQTRQEQVQALNAKFQDALWTAGQHATTAASLRQRLDQATAERDDARRKLEAVRTELGATREESDRFGAQVANLRAQLDAANASRQRLQEQLDDMAIQRNMARTDVAIARTDVHHDIARQIDILATDPGILRDWLTTCDPQPISFGELFHALAEKLRRPTPPSSVPPRRAQEERPHPGLHVTRGSGPSDIEADCPCPEEPCGAVDTHRAEWDCEHHPAGRAKTMRHMHRADQCPGARP